MAKTKVVPSKKEVDKVIAYKLEEEEDAYRLERKKMSIDLIDEIFEVLREQEEKLQNIYDLESSLKVMAVAVATIASDFANSNEELFRQVRQIKALVEDRPED